MFEAIAADALEAPWWLDALDPGAPWTDSDALAEAAERKVGAGLLLALMQVDPAVLTADEAVSYAQQAERFAAFAAGFVARARAGANANLIAHAQAEADSRTGSAFVTAEMLASAELAAALRMAPRTMDSQLEFADELVGPMAPLGEAMYAGHLPAGHAWAIAKELSRWPHSCDPDRAADFAALCDRVLAIVIPYAANHTPGQCARRARTLMVAADPRSAADRRRDAAEREHGVWLTPLDRGSCELTAVMPIAHGHAVLDAIRALAKDPRFETADGCVTVGQRRVAALSTLVLGDPGAIANVDGPVAEAKIKATVSVIVPASILGMAGQGAAAVGGTPAFATIGEIEGESVDADTLRDLLADAAATSTMRRVVTDASGCIIDAGRTRYAISDTQRYLIALRDRTCRFPGCSRKAHRCEIDHATSWREGGRTDLCNLGPLCKHHHQLKTHGGWLIIASDGTGACTWRSPVGRIYEHRPEPLVTPILAPVHGPPDPPAEPPPF